MGGGGGREISCHFLSKMPLPILSVLYNLSLVLLIANIILEYSFTHKLIGHTANKVGKCFARNIVGLPGLNNKNDCR